ncbi:MAG: hypothetical protein R2800_03475 [Flavipsychrobacter sp.]
MARQMPKDMQELLGKLHDPDTIRSIQGRWNEYVATNEQYEQNYPQQFAHQVEGNLKFKEQKSIPTPAEQMAMFEDMLREEIEEHLDEKELQGKDEVYELHENKNIGTPKPDLPNGRAEKVTDFKLNFEDRGLRDSPVSEDKTNDMDRSQELNVIWLQDYKDQKAKEAQEPVQDTPKQEPQPDKPYELNLTFGRLEEPDKSDQTLEPEEPGMEPEEG